MGLNQSVKLFNLSQRFGGLFQSTSAEMEQILQNLNVSPDKLGITPSRPASTVFFSQLGANLQVLHKGLKCH